MYQTIWTIIGDFSNRAMNEPVLLSDYSSSSKANDSELQPAAMNLDPRLKEHVAFRKRKFNIRSVCLVSVIETFCLSENI